MGWSRDGLALPHLEQTAIHDLTDDSNVGDGLQNVQVHAWANLMTGLVGLHN